MKYLLAFLLVSLAGCVTESPTQELGQYILPVLPSGTEFQYKHVNPFAGDELTSHTILYNDVDIEGESYYLVQVDGYGERDYELIRVHDHAVTEGQLEVFEECDITCELALIVQPYYDPENGYPIPLLKNSTWEQWGMQFYVAGTQVVKGPLGAREAIEIRGSDEEEIWLTVFKDIETGLDVRIEYNIRGVEGSIAMQSLTLGEGISEEDFLQELGQQLGQDSPLNQPPPVPYVYLEMDPSIDLDIRSQLYIGATAEVDVEFSVFLDDMLIQTATEPFYFAPPYPGAYSVEALVRAGSATNIDQAYLLVSGSLTFNAPCEIGVGRATPTCQVHNIEVPRGISTMRFGFDPTATMADEIVVETGQTTYTRSSTFEVEHDGSPGNWTVQFKPGVSVGAREDLTVRLTAGVLPDA